MTQDYDPKDCPMPLDFFLRRYGISRTTAWRWRKNGLPTLQVGAKIFCRESEFVRFMETQTATVGIHKMLYEGFSACPIFFLVQFSEPLFVFISVETFERGQRL